MPRRRAHYDARDNVVHYDATGLVGEAADVDTAFDELMAVGRTLPKKAYIVTCWAGVVLTAEGARRYGERLPELYDHYIAVVRYATNDLTTRVHIRTETIKQRVQGAKAMIYETRDEALAAIRRGDVAPAQPARPT
jgi:hypothetical protein